MSLHGVDETGSTTKGGFLPSLRHEDEKGDNRDEDSPVGTLCGNSSCLVFCNRRSMLVEGAPAVYSLSRIDPNWKFADS